MKPHLIGILMSINKSDLIFLLFMDDNHYNDISSLMAANCLKGIERKVFGKIIARKLLTLEDVNKDIKY